MATTSAAGAIAPEKPLHAAVPDQGFALSHDADRDVPQPDRRIGLGIVVLLLVVGFAAPIIAPNNPVERIRGHRLEGPSTEFWFGTSWPGISSAARFTG